MAVMTGSMVAAPVGSAAVVPIQRDRRALRPRTARPVTVVRICSDAPIGAALLMPVQHAGPTIAPLLPIQRDRHARRVRSGQTRRLTTLAVAFGLSLTMWVAIIGAVAALAQTL
jgi:hypothetical protein